MLRSKMNAYGSFVASSLAASLLASIPACGSSSGGSPAGTGGSAGSTPDASDDAQGGTGGDLPDAEADSNDDDVMPAEAGDGSDDATGSDASDASDDAAVTGDDDGGDASVPVVDQISGVVVSTLAGSGTPGTLDGTGAAAQFNNPVNVRLAPSGDLIVSDFDNGELRRVTVAGVVTTLTMQAGFERPFGLVFTSSGSLIVQTDRNSSGQGGTTTGTLWSVDTTTGAATVIQENLGRPRGLAAMSDTALFMTNVAAHWTRLFDLGTHAEIALAGVAGVPGFVDGSGSSARFNGPYGVARMPNGDHAVADMGNHAIRIVTSTGVVSTLAGDGVAGMVDGDLFDARFDSPRGVAVDTVGRIFVSDNGNHRIRVIDTTSATVRTVAGDGSAGFKDGGGGEAEFFGQEGLDVTSDGKTIYVADGNGGDPFPYHRIRKIQLP